jgi:Na+-translocating ferredoxin:NAD+ oxidoreductase RnfG subunit
MKCLKPVALGAVIFTSALTTNLYAENLPAGQVDFGTISPSHSGGQFVEVNLTSSLISLATKFIAKEQPEIADLLNGLQLVRVNVVGLDDDNRADLEKRIHALRKDLDGKGWERIVVAQQEDQDVSVYLKTKNKDTVQGLVVTVIDGKKQAVFVNVVGNIKPEQLSMIGEKLNIDPLQKLGKLSRKKTERAQKESEETEQ